jgi:sensor histidine kinase YesM
MFWSAQTRLFARRNVDEPPVAAETFMPTNWMHGITPARLCLIFVIFLAYTLNNPDYSHLPLLPRLTGILRNTAQFFLSSLPMLFIVVRTEIGTARWSPRSRIAALTLAVVAGALIFPLVRWGLRFGQIPRIGTSGDYWQYSVGHFFRALFVGGLLTSVLYFAAREKATQRLLMQTRLAQVEIDKQAAEARLQLLQAQIEPHFLFNSLASVKLLYEKEPQQGRSLLRNLGDYLRVAISRARLREAPLAEEVALARAFLAIFQVRMGARLRVCIDLPTQLQSALIPPLMIGTLVENAIKHGIGPRASGGTVSLSARQRGSHLEVEVADDGLGFRARSGRGVGLANTRARLETLFNGAGSLELAGNDGGGVTATMRIPLRSLAEAQTS